MTSQSRAGYSGPGGVRRASILPGRLKNSPKIPLVALPRKFQKMKAGATIGGAGAGDGVAPSVMSIGPAVRAASSGRPPLDMRDKQRRMLRLNSMLAAWPAYPSHRPCRYRLSKHQVPSLRSGVLLTRSGLSDNMMRRSILLRLDRPNGVDLHEHPYSELMASCLICSSMSCHGQYTLE